MVLEDAGSGTLIAEGAQRGQERGMLRDTLLRCLLNEVVAAYREHRSVKDITHELSFLIDQLNDDVGSITRGS